MEEAWMEELECRLQKDETYQMWQKASQIVISYLEEHLKEDHRDLLIDCVASLKSMEVFSLYYAYEIGVEHGRVAK